MRMIDADEILKTLKGMYFHGQLHHHFDNDKVAHNHAIYDASEQIKKAPTIDAVPVVRCGECANYKKRHVLTNDGQEKSYEEMPEEAFGDLNDGYVTHEYGINVGGKCMLDCGRGYPVDKSVFRSPNDFCSYGLKMDGDPHDSC